MRFWHHFVVAQPRAIFAIFVLASFGGCGDIEYAEDRYACTPGAPDTCPSSGWVCRWSSTGDEYRCFLGGVGPDAEVDAAVVCGPGTCGDGCCDPSAVCQPGTGDAVCGVGGASCEDCTLSGGVCVGQTCQSVSCVDDDGDGYGVDCVLGEDCDDDAGGVVGPCQGNGCPQGWAYIPAGDFEMGCDALELDDTCQSNEEPRHTVTMTAYCMEVTEVTVAAYRACEAAGVCTGLPTDPGGDYNWTASPESREDHPINGITWLESGEYCQGWLGGDLPTEAQWEKAARGGPVDTRKYPWGSSPEPDCTRANGDYVVDCNTTTPPYTWEVGSANGTDGDSPYWLKDMAGNVWEWVQDYYSSTFYEQCTGGCTDPLNTSLASDRVVRGGSFDYGALGLRVVWRGHLTPENRRSNVGFRCGRTP